MTASAAPPPPSVLSRVTRLFAKLGRWLCNVLLFFFIVWAALAIHFSNLPWPAARTLLAIAFFAFAIYALWITSRAKWRWAFVAAFSAVVIWHGNIAPSNNRPWRPEVALPPRAIIDGDSVRLTNYCNAAR